MNECKFFHYAPNYVKFYHITCQIILQGSDFFDDHDYDHGFFYNIKPTENYYVTCKILPHSLIANMLNKTIYGIDIGINSLKRKEVLSLNQKLDLEQDLERILPFHLTQHHNSNREISMNSNRNLNSPYEYNTQPISIADTSQTNFDNSFPQQTGVGYTNNTTNPRQENFNNIPQHVPKRLGSNGNTTLFCGNIGNNVMTTQAVVITDNSQNNGFIDPLSTSAAPQNKVTYNVTNSQQRIDFNNNIPQHIIDRENYGNTNSFHGNIMNNTPVTQSALTTNINQNYDGNDVNSARNFANIRQQVDLNNNYGETENIGNNVPTTQTNVLTCDHQDINDIVNHTNNNYEDADLHNSNIGNNVITMQTYGLTCDHQDANDIQVDSNHVHLQQ